MAQGTQAAPLPLARVRSFLKRRGWLTQVLAGLAIVLIAGGLLLNRYLSDRFDAAGTAKAYLTALASGAATTAWSLVEVGDAGKVDADLATKKGLAAQLAVASNRDVLSVLQVTGQRDLGSETELTVSYKTRSGMNAMTLDLVRDPSSKHYGIYPAWKVGITPAVVRLVAPSASGVIKVDGMSIASAGTLAVFPGRHRVEMAASAVFEAWSQDVQASSGKPVAISVQPKLSTSGIAAAAKGLKSTLANCVATRNPFGSACPDIRSYFLSPPSDWQLFGDPAGTAAYVVDAGGKVTGRGHYQVLVSYPSRRGTAHAFTGAPFQAIMRVGPDGSFSVDHFQYPPEGVTPLSRPGGVADDPVLSLVKDGLSVCMSSTSLQPVDCPNRVDQYIGSTSNIKWQPQGDPMAGAQLSWNGDEGDFQVRGTFTATADYEVLIGSSSDHRTRQDSAGYLATVIVEGSSPRLVTIDRKG